MAARNYVVRFFKKAEKKGEKDTFLGLVEVDDTNIGYQLPVMGKAWRQAPPRCLTADLVKVERTE